MSATGRGRETFATRFGLLMTVIGVAVGLGNVWRFPYMAGRFGGAAFVAFYVLAAGAIGVPGLIAEWTLGRATRRGPVGAWERAGAPFGRAVGWLFFLVVAAATAYYTVVLGWVLYHALGQAARGLGVALDAGAVLPPERGFVARSFALQAGATAVVVAGCAAVLLRGLRSGIEAASKVVMPALLAILLVLIARSLTLPGARAGLAWYLLKFDPAALRGGVLLAALGQAIFSLSLGGTYMVVYGSYMGSGESLTRNAVWTAAGDTAAGLLAGLAVLPAVFALGLEPGSGPGLVFATLPEVFARIPVGWAFGLLFFGGLFGAAWLSDVAAFEVLVAGLVDNTRLSRRAAVGVSAGLVLALALPPMTNLRVFVPWDLTFGSGMQTAGALLAVLTVGWSLGRASALERLVEPDRRPPAWLVPWLRWVIPAAILAVGAWWLATDVLGLVPAVG